MHPLQSGVGISVIALWLGHESPITTHQYVEADLAMHTAGPSRDAAQLARPHPPRVLRRQCCTGRWTLQQAADWRMQVGAGQGRIDPEIQRTVNWPAQLMCYFSGKEQILSLKDDCRARWGSSFSERRFHDELLAMGSVPYVFARAKLLGVPVPGL